MNRVLEQLFAILLVAMYLSGAVEYQIHGHDKRVGHDHNAHTFANAPSHASPSGIQGEGETNCCALCSQISADIPLRTLHLVPAVRPLHLHQRPELGRKQLSDCFGCASRRGPPVSV